MNESLLWHTERLMDSTMSLGDVCCMEALRNMERVTAITSEAGTPLPATSPMLKKSFSSRMKKSNRSPPTSLAVTTSQKMSMSVRSGNGG